MTSHVAHAQVASLLLLIISLPSKQCSQHPPKRAQKCVQLTHRKQPPKLTSHPAPPNSNTSRGRLWHWAWSQHPMHTGFQPVLQLKGPYSVVCHANQKCLLRHIVTYCHYCAATAETRRPGDHETRRPGAESRGCRSVPQGRAYAAGVSVQNSISAPCQAGEPASVSYQAQDEVRRCRHRLWWEAVSGGAELASVSPAIPCGTTALGMYPVLARTHCVCVCVSSRT